MNARALLGIVLLAVSAVAQAPPRADFTRRLVAAANDRIHQSVRYDPGYAKIPYPSGDVPPESGVCTDEIIRIYRAVGVDLQKEVHEDMAANRSSYPFKSKWHQVRLDTNIDHRRVPNLAVFFSRKGEALATSRNPADYAPGDIVVWMLPSGRDHIGMVVDRKSEQGAYLVEHNIGEDPKIEDILFAWKITGHYRYRPVSG